MRRIVLAAMMLTLLLAGPARAGEPIRLGLLAFGSVQWEIDTLRAEGRDAAHAIRVEPVELAGKEGAAVALMTSIRAVIRNPAVMALWGLIVAALLFLGSLPLFIGLTVVMPVLGHATWHLYRKLVVSDGAPRPTLRVEEKGKRSAVDFPAVLFPWAK